MKKLILLIIIATINLSCEGPKGEGGESLKLKNKSGTVIGFIELYNNVNIKKTDFSGVKIELRNSYSTYTATSNKKGKYSLNKLPIGSYNLTFTKDGYPKYKKFGFSNIGDTCYLQTRNLYANKKPVQDKDILITTKSYPKYTHIKIKFNNNSLKYSKKANIYISKNKNVSPTNYLYHPYGSYESHGLYQSFILTIDKKSCKSGTILYQLLTHQTSIAHDDRYFNKNKNIWVYPNLREFKSNIITIKIP